MSTVSERSSNHVNINKTPLLQKINFIPKSYHFPSTSMHLLFDLAKLELGGAGVSLVNYANPTFLQTAL